MSENAESEVGTAAAPEDGGDAAGSGDDSVTRKVHEDDPEAGADEGDDPVGTAEGTTPEQEEEREAEAALAAELDRLQDEFQALNDRHLRLAAEFENYRKRARGEMTEAWSRAQADLVRRLVDSLDDLERVTEQDVEATTLEGLLEGVELVEQKLRRTLEDAGVEVLAPEGEPFDPETMEAMLSVPAEEPEQDETVARVLQKGYLFKDHLVRPARVSVYKEDED